VVDKRNYGFVILYGSIIYVKGEPLEGGLDEGELSWGLVFNLAVRLHAPLRDPIFWPPSVDERRPVYFKGLPLLLLHQW